MDALLLLLAVICAVVGLIGAVAPALPGPPVSFLALLFTAFAYSDEHNFPVWGMVAAGVVALVVMLLDYFIPIWLANKTGGSKYGVWGMTIGIFVGFFGGVTGIILFPFLGALIGELFAKTPTEKAFKVATMSFVGFMLTTGLKLIYSLLALVLVLCFCGTALWDYLKHIF